MRHGCDGGGNLSLYLTLCYADCTAQPVPIPGDPCRSEDQLMADSRVADDYRLELATTPPPQVEHDALLDFVDWLAQVPVVNGASVPPPDPALEQEWAEAIRLAAQPWLDLASASAPESPPTSPPDLDDYLFGSPPSELSIASSHRAAFLGVAFRIWVTELRPLWMARTCAADPHPEQDCLLLARLAVPVIWVGGSPTGAWQVNGDAVAIETDESRRPLLVHGRLLQGWLLTGNTPCVESLPSLLDRLVTGSDASFGRHLIGLAENVDVTERASAIELSLPQPVAPTSSPSFDGLRAKHLEVADLRATGNLQVAIRSVEARADVTLTPQDYCLVCSGDDITLTLPECTATNRGKVYVIKNANPPLRTIWETTEFMTNLWGITSSVTVAASPGDSVEGQKTLELDRGSSFRLISDGVNDWYQI